MNHSSHESGSGRGALAAVASYVIWGLFPLYWKQLEQFDATELIAHRIVWSLVFVLGVNVYTGGWTELARALRSPTLSGLHVLSGVCVSVNWLTYVWGVNHGYILEASLGYFLVPLVNVACGRFLLGEHLRKAQWAAIGLAGVGVSVQFVSGIRVPWVAVVLAASWAAYGLLRKRSPLGSLAGLTLETALLAPLAGGLLIWRALHGEGILGHASAVSQGLVLSAGFITAVPLLLFAYGVRCLRLSTVGLLQYIVPTLNFLLGAFVYGETVDRTSLVSFALIWSALALYSIDNVRAARARAR